MNNNIIGIDIGGTKTAIGIVDDKGKVLDRVKFQTETDRGFPVLIKRIINSLKDMKVKEVGRIGIGMAGQVDGENGIQIFTPNIPKWKNITVVRTLEDKLAREFKKRKEFRIEIGNDANCFALAESVYGAGRGYEDIIGVTLGTGLGGGLVLGGKLYKGQGYASEFGHMIVLPGGKKCTCGSRGCLENYVSGRAIEKAYYGKRKKRKKALEIEEEALRLGNKSFAYKIYEEAGFYLGVGFSNLINILDPEIIVVGGGLSRSKILLKIAKKQAQKNIFYKKRKAMIMEANLGQDAGIIGASLLVR